MGLEWVWGLLQLGFVRWAPPSLLHKTTLTTGPVLQCRTICRIILMGVSSEGKTQGVCVQKSPKFSYKFWIDRWKYVKEVKGTLVLTSYKRVESLHEMPTVAKMDCHWWQTAILLLYPSYARYTIQEEQEGCKVRTRWHYTYCTTQGTVNQSINQSKSFRGA